MLAPAVLLVDDDEATLELVAYALRAKGYRILQAKDASEALEVADSYNGNIPLLLTDLAMPGVSGRELAKRIHRERPETKIMYMTAYPHWLDDSCRLLPKPFTPDQLLAKVQEVLSLDDRSCYNAPKPLPFPASKRMRP